MGFTKPTYTIHADSPGVYTSDKSLNLSTIDKIHLKYDCINGSILDSCRQPFLYSFFQINQQVIKYFPSLNQNTKKIKKSFLNTITFYLEDDYHKENNFTQETLTFTLKITTI